MKTIKLRNLILQTLFLISSCNSVNAQDWFEGNPNWSYDYYNPCLTEVNGWDKLKFQKDTIVDNKTCKLFKYHRFRAEFGYGTWYNVSDYILYEEDDVVYHYQNSFKKLYDFNLEVGDTIITLIDADEFICDDTLISIIDQIYFTEVNGLNLTTQKWKNLNNTDEFGEYFTIIEKIGAIGGFFFDMSWNWGCAIDHCHPYHFECYFNSELDINYPENINCDEILPTNELNQNKEQVNIFPNPSFDKFHFQSNKKIDSIQLFTPQGNKLNLIFSANTLNLTNKNSGIYLVHIIYVDGTIEVQKLIKI